MAFLIYVGLLALGALVEATLGYRLDAGGGRANVVLVMVVAWALLRGVEEGAVVGAAGGLALDLVSGTPFGLHTALLAAIGAVCSLGEATRGGGLTLFFSAVLATVAYHAATVLVLQVLGRETPGFVRLVSILLPTVVMNSIATPIVFILARRLVRSLSGWRRLELE